MAAKASEDAAKASQSAATGSATSAASSKSAAKVSEDKAADYASAALASEGAAKGSETAAASSASSAASSKTAAASSKSAAASSASAAVVSKTAAKTSETNAASSASAAAASKAAAKISETNAAQSAATAQTSQAAAKTSEDNAANSVFEAQSIRNEVAEIAGGTAPDSQRLGGKTKAEVVSEARAGLQAADSKLQRLVDSEFDFTHGNDFRIRDGRALAAHTPEVLYVNYNGDFSNVSAKGAWTFSEPVTVSDVTLEATTGEYGDKALKVSNTRGYLKLGAQNNNFCHYETDRPNHWFNKEVRVQGEIYAGSGYSQKVYHEGHKPTPNEIGAVAKGESITLTNQEIVWSENSDGARIGFKNDADNDANSYLYFQTSDNLNEYFKWQHQTGASTVEWMSLKNASLSVKGRINAAGATFDAGNSTTVNIRANSSGAAVLNVCAEADAQTTGIVYVGQSPNHGGGIEYNGDNSPVTSDSGADFFTLFRRSNGQTHWTARNHQANNNWEFRSEVKAASFKEGNTPLTNKYHPKSAKLARFESSEIDTSGQDFKIRNKRVLVGATDKLVINYNADWAKVDARGEWDFNGDILARYDIKMAGDDSYIWTPNKANGSTGLYDPHSNITAFKYTNGQGFDYGADINITKNNPWLTLDSSSSGSVNIEQAAGISIGESGRDNAASLHISYQGNGYSYIGMGDLGADNIADNWAMQMNYQSRWVKFRSDIHLQDSNTKLAKGVSNTVRAITSHGYVDIGPMNTGWCHFETDRERFYFGQSLHVKGELYAGPNYNQKVIHQGNFNQQLQASANQVTSGDSQKFAGKTEQQWQDYIQDPVRAAVAVTNPIAAAFI
ncbi:hypothetical protein PSECIP111854_02042 [Pseudoalteromonas sp. CIP111854]|uniref:Uncharacterized protein n=1 Tax=Pseudoalteromonas holothuriae TaxID=2963714 RepID=A0A9W4QXU6_9GAMM|nr:hypothetical protein PSECIP111854_02042 [Pseudoalteromonas sp. CIP111854]